MTPRLWLVALVGLGMLCVSTLAGVGCSDPAEGAAQTGAAATTVSSAAPAIDQPHSGGTLRVAMSEPKAIDPLRIQELWGIEVGRALFDPLVRFDPVSSEIQPLAAESWESSENCTIWTFHLRRGAKFHNGREVVAADFKYQWERLCDPENESPVAFYLASVKGFHEMQSGEADGLSGLETPDDYTLRVTLAYPFADFPYGLALPVLAPTPREAVEKDPRSFAEMPVGNGPFRMAEPWSHDQYIKLVRFEGYSDETPLLDGVDFRIFRDQETAFLEFKAGEVDTALIPTGQVQAAVKEYGQSANGLEASPAHQVLLGPELAVYFLVVNCRDELLKNIDLRRALSLAINREAIAEAVFEGARKAASSIIPEGMIGYEADAWPHSRYDPGEAKDLLARAGYPGGTGLPPISLVYNTGMGHDHVCEMVQADLSAIGVQSKLDGMEWSAYIDKLQNRSFQIGTMGWIADSPVIDCFVYPLFMSESPDNLAGYADSAIDTSVRAARQIEDVDRRVDAYRAIIRDIGISSPVIPLVGYRHRLVVSDRVRHLIYSPQGAFNLRSCWMAAD